MALSRRIVAEALGTAFLLAAVVGSGIMGQKLAGGNIAIVLLANTLATRYIWWDSSLRCTGLYGGAVARRFCCDCSFSLACALAPF
jgi:glycerol uptake facilitator-like aquaporin